jgi:hypothetical protein
LSGDATGFDQLPTGLTYLGLRDTVFQTRGQQLSHRLAREGDDLARPTPNFHTGKVTNDMLSGTDRRGIIREVVLATPREVIVSPQQIETIKR